jgi:hypothetical protein
MMTMIKRRSFLQILGLAPFAVPVVVAAMEETSAAPPVPIGSLGSRGVIDVRVKTRRPLPHTLVARKFTGEHIQIGFRDLGDLLLAYDTNGYPYRAYTSHFRGPDFEVYLQVDAELAEFWGNAGKFRQAEDLAYLEWEIGVNPSTITIDGLPITIDNP